MKVVFFHRKKVLGNFSIEKLFEQVRRSLPDSIKASIVEAKWLSRGFFKRLFIGIQASLNQGDVNHITGDIHFIALFLKKRKTILTVHDVGFMNNSNPFARTLLKWFWITMPVRHSARVTTVSEATKRELTKCVKIDPTRISVIYNPISANFVRDEKEFNTDEPVILQIGTKPNKNLSRLAQALKGISCKLEIIGELNEGLLKELRECGVKFTNSTNLSEDEVVQKYRSCDIVSLVSTNEGFGLPIIEGNAVGRVVVTGNISSMPEIAGDAAHLVDPFDILSIREGILKVINDKAYRERLIGNGFQNVKRFEMKEIVKQYIAIYKSILMR